MWFFVTARRPSHTRHLNSQAVGVSPVGVISTRPRWCS